MKTNKELFSYIGQRFWCDSEGRFINAGGVNFEMGNIWERNNPRRYSIRQKHVEWVRPTYIFDDNNKMIFEKDIISDGEDAFGYVGWHETRFVIWVFNTPHFTELIIEDAQRIIVGNMYEDGAKYAPEQ